MTIHQQYDLRLRAYFGPTRYMTPADAATINRDLYLSGKTWLGWKAVEDTPRPAVPLPTQPGPPDGLIQALIGLGYKQREAKRLAATVSGGTIEEGIRRICAKELV